VEVPTGGRLWLCSFCHGFSFISSLFCTPKKVLFYFLSGWGERFREGIYMVRFFMFYRILLAKDRMKDNVHLFSLLCFVRACLDRRGLEPEENEVD